MLDPRDQSVTRLSRSSWISYYLKVDVDFRYFIHTVTIDVRHCKYSRYSYAHNRGIYSMVHTIPINMNDLYNHLGYINNYIGSLHFL